MNTCVIQNFEVFLSLAISLSSNEKMYQFVFKPSSTNVHVLNKFREVTILMLILSFDLSGIVCLLHGKGKLTLLNF